MDDSAESFLSFNMNVITMHRCLALPEIVANIIGVMEVSDETYPTLAALARTNRMFSEPALDALWYSQIGLGNLVRCMPSDLWKEDIPQEGELGLVLLSFKRAMQPEDLSRLTIYSPRVRDFSPEQWKSRMEPSWLPATLIMLDAVQQLEQHASQLLPNIRALIYQIKTEADWTVLKIILGQRLQSLHLSITRQSSEENLAPILRRLQALSAPLRHLHIAHHTDLRDSPDFSVYFTQLRSLVLRTPGPLPLKVFTELASLLVLYRLSIEFRFNDQDDPISPFPSLDNLPSGAFPALVDLTILFHHWLLPAKWLRMITLFPMQNLRALSVTSRYLREGCEATVDLDEMLSRLKAAAASMEDLTLEFHEPIGQRPASLRGLGAFTKLKKLTIAAYGLELNMNDEALRDLAASWPRLEELSLLYTGDGSEIQLLPLTLNAVGHLVRYCPRLGRLSLDVDVGPGDLQDTGSAQNTRMISLWLGNHPLRDDPRRVAAYLTKLLPNLRHLEYIQERWDEVQHLLESRASTQGDFV